MRQNELEISVNGLYVSCLNLKSSPFPFQSFPLPPSNPSFWWRENLSSRSPRVAPLDTQFLDCPGTPISQGSRPIATSVVEWSPLSTSFIH